MITYCDHRFSSSSVRPELERLKRDAHRQRFDVIAVWKFDRFARSTRELVFALEQFQALGIDFVSVTQSIDTSGPMGKLVFSALAAIAEFERELIRESGRGHERGTAQGEALWATGEGI